VKSPAVLMIVFAGSLAASACGGAPRVDGPPDAHGVDPDGGSVPDAGPGPDARLDGGTAADLTPPVTTASPAGAGIHQGSLTVTLSVNEPAVTHYTLDGTLPDASSPVYSGPLAIDRTLTLRFFSVDTAGNVEAVKAEHYPIDIVHLLLLEAGSN
jgi:hypothetical protein